MDKAPPVGGGAPGCPLTAAQISTILATTMASAGDCSFERDSVWAATIGTLARDVGVAAFETQRDLMADNYGQVKEIDLGDKGLIGVGGVDAEAFVVSADGTYQVILTGFFLDQAGYEQLFRKLFDAIID